MLIKQPGILAASVFRARVVALKSRQPSLTHTHPRSRRKRNPTKRPTAYFLVGLKKRVFREKENLSSTAPEAQEALLEKQGYYTKAIETIQPKRKSLLFLFSSVTPVKADRGKGWLRLKIHTI